MRFAVTCIAGAALIAISAETRGSFRRPVAPRPLSTIQTASELEVVADVPLNGDASEIPEAVTEVVAPVVSTPEPLDDSQRLVIDFWRAWQSQAIEELPEAIREKSEHRSSIEETYQMALRNAGIAEGADAEVVESLVNGGLAITHLAELSFVSVEATMLSDNVVMTEFFHSN